AVTPLRILTLASFFLVAGTAAGQDLPTAPETKEEDGEIVDLDSIEDEPEGSLLDHLRSGESTVHLFGYVEAHFNDPKTGTIRDGDDNRTEIHRFVIGVGYDFSERIHFEAEVDFEHSFDEPEIEFAHVTLDLPYDLHLLVGSVLVPMGFLNETHEPPTFYSVERPQVNTLLIPTTWQEIGAGVRGSVGPYLNYRAFLLATLQASGFTPLKGVRGGRTKTMKAVTNDVAGVVRLEGAPFNGTKIGFSGYIGGADQDETGVGRVTVTMVEADVRLNYFNFEVRGVGVYTYITGTEDLAEIDAGTGLPTGKAPARQQWGGYGEIAYHFAPHLPEGTLHDIVPFVRFEHINTQGEIRSQFDRDDRGLRNILAAGVAVYPHPDVVFKVDVEDWRDGDGDRVTRLNLGVGLSY
ncbi:MAG: hypothetical protein O6952_01305, partial [Planctomycetota bacterium]|nr:hypothetical protein [Planctomycetota bacterium]